MAKEKLRLRVATPECVKYDREAEMVIMRCITGDMGILPKHEACSAVLDYGILRIVDEGSERRMAVFGGMAQVRDDMVTILTNDAQWPEDIDLALAEELRDSTERLISESSEGLEIQKEQVTLRRALVQIEVSAYPLISRADHSGGS